MQKRDLLLLYLAGVMITALAASGQAGPGYMDAEYYTVGGIRLAQGHGFSEPFFWNYLDNPSGLPHPSHLYWMPLPSIIATAGLVWSGGVSFAAAQIPFVLLSGLIPVLSALLALRMSGKRRHGWLAGGFATLSGYYLSYQGIPESVVPYLVLGAGFILLAFSPPAGGKKRRGRAVLLGFVAGLMHLSRADGIIWLAAGLVVTAWKGWAEQKHSWKAVLCLCGFAVIGYLVPMSAWYGRNLTLYGSLFTPGSNLMLWLTDYNQTFAYPASTLSPESWLASGVGNILKVRLDALVTNLETTVAVQGLVFLFPLILVGLWRLRSRSEVKFGAGMWLVTLALMTVAFPFAGPRGGFLHSGAALQALFWAVIPTGLEAFCEIGIKLRNWKMERALPGFGLVFLILAGLTTAGLYWSRVIGDPDNPKWLNSENEYAAIDLALNELGIKDDEIVMINNPPGFWLITQRQAIVIPDGGVETSLAAAMKYGCDFLVLEENHPEGLNKLYDNPRSFGELTLLQQVGTAQIFQIEDEVQPR